MRQILIILRRIKNPHKIEAIFPHFPLSRLFFPYGALCFRKRKKIMDKNTHRMTETNTHLTLSPSQRENNPYLSKRMALTV